MLIIEVEHFLVATPNSIILEKRSNWITNVLIGTFRRCNFFIAQPGNFYCAIELIAPCRLHQLPCKLIELQILRAMRNEKVPPSERTLLNYFCPNLMFVWLSVHFSPSKVTATPNYTSLFILDGWNVYHMILLGK